MTMNLHACRRSLCSWLAGRIATSGYQSTNSYSPFITNPSIANLSHLRGKHCVVVAKGRRREVEDDAHDHDIRRRRSLALKIQGQAFRHDTQDKEIRFANGIGFNGPTAGGIIIIAGQDQDVTSTEVQYQCSGASSGQDDDNEKSTFIHFDRPSDLSPIYPLMPQDATIHFCIDVYDGDTLTLEDGTRVRLLGIDTPEIKGNQDFSQEAKRFTVDYCLNKTIHLTFLYSGGVKNPKNFDHYGRLLANVWVPMTDKTPSMLTSWLCVNEGLVVSGLAHAYFPSNTKKVHTYKKLICQQSYSQMCRLGQWALREKYFVTTAPAGRAFHRNGCEHLSQSKNLKVLPALEAYGTGRHPCRHCKPNVRGGRDDEDE